MDIDWEIGYSIEKLTARKDDLMKLRDRLYEVPLYEDKWRHTEMILDVHQQIIWLAEALARIQAQPTPPKKFWRK